MQGTILAINVDGTHHVHEVSSPTILARLRDIVNGHIEIVPHWDRINWGGRRRHCVVFCNEEGKLRGLEINIRATNMWHETVGAFVPDVLVGNVAVVWGDDEFMAAI